VRPPTERGGRQAGFTSRSAVRFAVAMGPLSGVGARVRSCCLLVVRVGTDAVTDGTRALTRTGVSAFAAARRESDPVRVSAAARMAVAMSDLHRAQRVAATEPGVAVPATITEPGPCVPQGAPVLAHEMVPDPAELPLPAIGHYFLLLVQTCSDLRCRQPAPRLPFSSTQVPTSRQNSAWAFSNC
jgi:hypothetical protein